MSATVSGTGRREKTPKLSELVDNITVTDNLLVLPEGFELSGSSLV